MHLLLTIICITSIWCLGVFIVTQEEMALQSWRVWADKKYKSGAKWVDPLFRCIWCMASLHSLVGYAFAFGLGIIKIWSWKYLVMWPLVICGASLLNGLLWSIASLLMSANTYYEALMQPQEPNDERPIDEEPKEHYLKDAINSGVS